MIAQAAVAGVGIALLPRYTVEQELVDNRLEIVAGDVVDTKISYYLIVPEARASSRAVEAFTAWVMAQAKTWSVANRRSIENDSRKAALQEVG